VIRRVAPQPAALRDILIALAPHPLDKPGVTANIDTGQKFTRSSHYLQELYDRVITCTL
jgi:hypothetical protein